MNLFMSIECKPRTGAKTAAANQGSDGRGPRAAPSNPNSYRVAGRDGMV